MLLFLVYSTYYVYPLQPACVPSGVCLPQVENRWYRSNMGENSLLLIILQSCSTLGGDPRHTTECALAQLLRTTDVG